MTKQSGFTLIEIIVSLVLVGILATVAGMGLVAGTQGYVFTKENTHMTQKVQLAMTRLNREILELSDVTTATSSTLAFEGVDGNKTLGLDGDTIKIAGDGVALTAGDILIDNVSGFTLTYYQGDETWVQGTDDIQLLSSVKIDLIINRSDSGLGQISFSTIVNPRNNENYGGASSVSGSSPGDGSRRHCFVATAAFGFEDHPSVRILRQFRDRYLQTWEGGRRLVRFYYAYGPAWAQKIQNRPKAAAFARALLAPLVGLAFVLLDFPWLLFWLLILSLVLTHFGMKRIKKRAVLAAATALANRRGSLLIGLIITMVVFAALGAAMLPLTTTAIYNPIGANSAARAYFLAESGYRYAASVFLHAGDESDQDDALETMHNQTYTLSDQEGQFQLSVYSYWFKTVSAPNGRNLTAEAIGGIPSDITFGAGYLYINGWSYSYSSASVNGDQVTFVRSHWEGNWPYISTGTACYPTVLSYSYHSQTVTEGGNITFNSWYPANAFPEKNGRISINDHIYQYATCNLTTNQLEGITDPNDDDMDTFYVSNNTSIILQKFISFHSVGSFAPGGVMAASREVIYHVPIDTGETTATSEFHDTFENMNKWHDSTMGSHAIASVSGDNALDVTGYTDTQRAVIALDWDETDVDLEESWESAGNYLSYDVQVKVMVDNESYYMAGITFRMESDGDGYGVSFLRGVNGYPYDGVYDDLVPPVYQSGYVTYPMIVLWRQWNNDNQREWLAYKVLSSSDHVVDSDSYLKSFSTLVVRIQEGYGIGFNSGGTTAITDGDTVTGQSTGSTGVVKGDPIVTSGSWSSGNAYGYLLLNNVTGNFSSHENLLVDSENRATSFATESRYNLIRIYYGDTSAHGTASTDATDNDRLANTRGTVNWPADEVDEWTADTDYLTLVEWNSNVDNSVTLLSTTDEPNGIIASNSFTSPSSGSFTSSEVGLFAHGFSADEVYFDDFAIRTTGSASGYAFMPSLQE